MSEESVIPKCGCGGDLILHEHSGVYWLACSNGDLMQGNGYFSKEEAIEAWIRATGTDKSNSPFKINGTDAKWRCGNCHTPIGKHWVYCQKCGHLIDWCKPTVLNYVENNG